VNLLNKFLYFWRDINLTVVYTTKDSDFSSESLFKKFKILINSNNI
jgi:hypothetical protein